MNHAGRRVRPDIGADFFGEAFGAIEDAAADGDLGAVLGWGFPTWTGGTVSLIETVGLASFVEECDRMAEAYGDRFLPPEGLRAKAQAGEGFDWS